MSVQYGFNAHHLAAIDAAIGAAITARSLPGAVYWLERGAVHTERAYGRLDFGPAAAPVTVGTVFDVASLTKVLVTAPAILLLHEAGQIDLEAPLLRYLPECAGGGKDAITVRQLLTHTSGLLAGLPASPAWQGREAALLLASLERVTHVPGSLFRYSDINYILLGLLIERMAGVPLDVFAGQRLFAPLRMQDTGYRPLTRGDGRPIAPTQRGAVDANSPLSKAQRGLAPGAVLQGQVHDPTVRRMGGVAGSAGVFSTARDVARFARMLLAGGELDGVRVLHADSVRLLCTAQSPPGITALRGMGMDIDSPFARRPRGRHYRLGSYGHTGFTGCILWIDPVSGSFYVFLSNRVYPDDRNSILPLYAELGTLSAEAVLSAQQ
jgi:CubicO group peptidase (beta-lactamase class C family)